MKSAGPRFEFGDFVLVPDEHLLLRAGAPVRLARKDFELLVALVDREGGLVRKEELLERLWPATFVEEGNLTKHVSTLRKALGDADGARPLIETVPRTGFRFVAPVRRVEVAAETRPVGAEPPASPRADVRVAARRPRTMMLVGATVLAAAFVVPGIFRREENPPERNWRAVAILPFQTLNGTETGSDALGIGLADGIITRLSGQRVLPVRPTSAVLAYAAGPRPDARTLGRALDAGVLLEGHIQRDAETVRVSVQLTDAEAGAPVWAETFDQTSSELFKLEDAIAERVAAALRLQLAAVEQERLRRRYTSNAAAYEAY